MCECFTRTLDPDDDCPIHGSRAREAERESYRHSNRIDELEERVTAREAAIRSLMK